MVYAYVMVKTAAGESESLRDELAAVDGVGEAHIVAGNWDLIIEVEGGEMGDVLHAVVGTIQGYEGVEDTKTYISLS
ncbi:MAG: Lrp/AsnC family transcriptional regulator [Halobacteriaceae archaeon]